MDIVWIVVGSLVGLGIGIVIGRSKATQALVRAADLEVERDSALEHAAKIQRAADDRKAAVQAAKQLEAVVAAARADAAAAVAARDEIAGGLASLEARHAKIVDDYRSEIAERERTMLAQAERLKRADAAAEKALAATPAAVKSASAPSAGVGARVGTEIGGGIGAGSEPAGRNGEAEAPPGKGVVEGLEREVAKTKQALEAMTREREESRTASQKLQSRIRELHLTQERLNASFADRNRRIAELEARLGHLGDAPGTGSFAAQSVVGAGAPGIIDSQRLDEKSANEALVRAYRHDMAAKTREIKALEERLSKRQRTIARLKDKLDRAKGSAIAQGSGAQAIGADAAIMDALDDDQSYASTQPNGEAILQESSVSAEPNGELVVDESNGHVETSSDAAMDSLPVDMQSEADLGDSEQPSTDDVSTA